MPVDRIAPEIWFGRPGSLVSLPPPEPGYVNTLVRPRAVTNTAGGGRSVSTAGYGRRQWTLNWTALPEDEFYLLEGFNSGVRGVGPWAFFDPSLRNKAFPNQSTGTDVLGTTDGFAGQVPGETLIASSAFTANSLRSYAWTVPAGAPSGGVLHPTTPWPKRTTTRTNVVPNPSFEVDLATWSTTTALGTMARSTTWKSTGTASVALTPTAGGGGTVELWQDFGVTAPLIVSPSTNYVLSFKTFSAAVRDAEANLAWYDGAGNEISNAANRVTHAAGVVATASVTATSPANAVRARVLIRIYGSVGNVCYVDDVLVEVGTTVNRYFDGSTPGGSWTGTAHNSTSTVTSSRWFYPALPGTSTPAAIRARGSVACSGRLELRYYDAAFNNVAVGIGGYSALSTTAFTAFSVPTSTAPANAAWVSLTFALDPSTVTATTTVYLGALQVEYGTATVGTFVPGTGFSMVSIADFAASSPQYGRWDVSMTLLEVGTNA